MGIRCNSQGRNGHEQQRNGIQASEHLSYHLDMPGPSALQPAARLSDPMPLATTPALKPDGSFRQSMDCGRMQSTGRLLEDTSAGRFVESGPSRFGVGDVRTFDEYPADCFEVYIRSLPEAPPRTTRIWVERWQAPTPCSMLAPRALERVM